MNDPSIEETRPPSAPPISAFAGPVAELISQRMLLPPARPGLLAMLDHFEILGIIGSGGMGLVLRGRDLETNREVAVKLVKSELVNNVDVVRRFLKEAGHLQRLRHTGIVPVQAISDRTEGPYFVMPFFEKGSLANRLKAGKPLETTFIVNIAIQIAEGLSFAHRRGIIHRDLKPANILLAANDQACLADFGLARSLFNDSIVDVESRQIEGTVPYMSPAVAAGDAEDTRCDIYSFGALLYEMLTGQPPYTGRGMKEILDRISVGPPTPILTVNPAADRGLVAVAERCMARELRDRYADMRDVVKDLQRIRTTSSLGEFQTKSGRGIPKIAWMAGTVAAILLVAGILWHENSRSIPLPKPPAPPPVPPLATLNITTSAGQPGVGGYADGTASQAQFWLPNSIAADAASGIIYVADTANNTIRKIAANGMVSTFAGLAGSHGTSDGTGSEARFWAPFGIAVDSAGNVYVADTGNNTIRKITPAGVVTTLAGLGAHPGSVDGPGAEARFRNPWDVAVDSAGDVFVADLSNNAIRKITPAGVVTTFAGQLGTSGSADGTAALARFNAPSGVATDKSGNVYVSENDNDTIRKITPDGTVSTLAGMPEHPGNADGTGTDARFRNPQGLVVDAEGNLYIADTGNKTVRKLTAKGVVTTLAGLAGAGGTTDGAANDARFSGPGGITADKTGAFYIADANNHTIRKITAPAPAAH